jgi:hypothetical protein
LEVTDNEAQEGSGPASGIIRKINTPAKPAKPLTETDDLKPALVAKVMPELHLELDHLEPLATPPAGRTIEREGPEALALGREHLQIQGRGRISVGYYSG